MRAVLFGMAAVGVGGAAVTHGFGGGSDFERDIAKSPTAVYSAYSAGTEAGEISEPADVPGGVLTVRIKKQQGRSIVYEALTGKKSVLRMEFDFEPLDNGAGTHMTADLDVDRAGLDSLDPTRARKFSQVPEAVIKIGFRRWMEESVKQVEAGKTLIGFDILHPGFADTAGGTFADSHPSAAVAERRWEAERAQRRAAEPMVDPNEAARSYLHGGSNDGE